MGGFRDPSSNADSYNAREVGNDEEEEEEEEQARDAPPEVADDPAQNEEGQDPPLLAYRLIETIEQPPAETYRSGVRTRPGQLLDVDQFCYGELAQALQHFLREIYLRRRMSLKAWLNFTIEFSKDDLEGVRTIAAPFNLDSCYIPHTASIAQVVSDLMSALLEKIALFLASGSGWVLQNFLSSQLDVLYLPRNQFNKIGGRSKAEEKALRFQVNAVHHLQDVDPKTKVIRQLFDLCDDGALCFPVALGAGIHPNLHLYSRLSDMSVSAVNALRKDLINLAYSRFTFQSISAYPVSFEDIRAFINDNEDRALISVVGLSMKTTSGHKNHANRSRNSTNIWPIYQSKKFLPRSLVENLPVIYLAVTAEVSSPNIPDKYHIALVRDFQHLMRNRNLDCRTSFFCPTCLGKISKEGLSDHAKKCEKVLGGSDTCTEVQFPRPGNQCKFQMRLYADAIKILGVVDLETARQPVADPGMFGQLTQCEYALKPISYSAFLTFNVNGENLPKLIPKVLITKDHVVAKFYQQMAVELLFCQTILKRENWGLHMTREQRLAREVVTHCGSCKRAFKSRDEIVAHHEHSRRRHNFLG